MAGALVLAGGGMVVATAPQAAAQEQICEKYGSTSVQGGRYIVQNNVWGSDIQQCIEVTDSGFTIVSGEHNNSTDGAPGAYPSIYAGCHYGNCTSGSGLPLQVSALGNASSTASYTTVNSGAWNAAYDLWYDPNPDQQGQNAAELMIWGNHAGPPQPVGSQVGTVQLAGATWDVWVGNIGWTVTSYVRQQTTNSLNVNIAEFTTDAVGRGQIDPSWYLTSVQFGFEPWQGGPGLAVNSFGFNAS